MQNKAFSLFSHIQTLKFPPAFEIAHSFFSNERRAGWMKVQTIQFSIHFSNLFLFETEVNSFPPYCLKPGQ
jgi:hypothetical protein